MIGGEVDVIQRKGARARVLGAESNLGGESGDQTTPARKIQSDSRQGSMTAEMLNLIFDAFLHLHRLPA